MRISPRVTPAFQEQKGTPPTKATEEGAESFNFKEEERGASRRTRKGASEESAGE